MLLCFWLKLLTLIAITLDTQYLHDTVYLFISPRILNTPSPLCSEKLAFHQEIHCPRDKVPTLDFFSLELNLWASNSCRLQSSSSTNPFGWVTTRQNFARLLLTHLLCCVGLSLSLTCFCSYGIMWFHETLLPSGGQMLYFQMSFDPGFSRDFHILCSFLLQANHFNYLSFFYQRLPI